jgi:hypothetical protein
MKRRICAIELASSAWRNRKVLSSKHFKVFSTYWRKHIELSVPN